MPRVILIAALTFAFFIIESALFNVLGRWFKPDLLLLLIIFFNLTLGIRYSILAALFAGLWKDSFGIDIFGLNIFTFIACAYLTTFIKRYLDPVGSRSSRILIVCSVTILSVFIRYVLDSIFSEIDFGQMVMFVMLPEAVTTTVAATYTFQQLRKCVLRLSV